MTITFSIMMNPHKGCACSEAKIKENYEKYKVLKEIDSGLTAVAEV